MVSAAAIIKHTEHNTYTIEVSSARTLMHVEVDHAISLFCLYC